MEFPEVNPIFRPSMRLINLVTLGTVVTTIETSQPHFYESGLTVRIIIPPHFGLEQLNNYLAPITVTSPTAFTMELNSSAFNPAEIPVTPLQYNSFPHVVPVGEINSNLNQATRNILG